MPNVLTELIEQLAAGRLRVVDLTQTLSSQTPRYPLPSKFNASPAFKMWELSRYDGRVRRGTGTGSDSGEHTGTHFDAPIVGFPEKNLPDTTVDRIPPTRFVGPACVIDVSKSRRKSGLSAEVESIEAWETTVSGGCRPVPGCCADDGSKLAARKDYINVNASGPHTPGLAKENIWLLATDRESWVSEWKRSAPMRVRPATLDPPFPNHYLMHGGGKFGFASLCNLDQLPPTGAIVIAAPLKIVGGWGSPLRVIAIAP